MEFDNFTGFTLAGLRRHVHLNLASDAYAEGPWSYKDN